MGYKNIISGIYKIESIIKPSRFYIGSALNLKGRERQHLGLLKRGIHHSIKLQRHYNKYGKDDIRFVVLLTCEVSDLITNEQFFIDALNPYFNCSPTAGSCRGVKWTKESKDKKSQQTKNYFNDPINRKKQSEIITQYFKDNPEELQRIGRANYLYFAIPENREKMSQITKKYFDDNPEQKYRIVDVAVKTGKSQTPEAKKKRMESLKKIYSDPNYIHPMKGKKRDRDAVEKATAKGKETRSLPGYVNPRVGTKMSKETIAKRTKTLKENRAKPDYVDPRIGRKLSKESIDKRTATFKLNRSKKNE